MEGKPAKSLNKDRLSCFSREVSTYRDREGNSAPIFFFFFQSRCFGCPLVLRTSTRRNRLYDGDGGSEELHAPVYTHTHIPSPCLTHTHTHSRTHAHAHTIHSTFPQPDNSEQSPAGAAAPIPAWSRGYLFMARGGRVAGLLSILSAAWVPCVASLFSSIKSLHSQEEN